MDTLTYGSDSELRWWRQDCGTWRYLEYASDRSGNRLAAVDTTGARIPQSLMSYTARGQLYFSMTPTASTANYDYNWHFYDGNGLRVLTHRQLGSGWVPGTDYQDNGNRTYYVYDGADVALTIGCGATSCSIDQRVMSGGVDQPLAGWFRGATGTRALLFVADAQGSTRAALRADGLRETDATLWSRDPFGGLQGASGTGGAYNTETGFAGASTPNATGGFTYLRNRWYDPATGRFLTQDPIGLAGGVNLYSYAGNNPVTFSDPFGLCPPRDNNPDDCTSQQFLRWEAAHIRMSRGSSWEGVDPHLRRAAVRTSMRLQLDLYVSSTNQPNDGHTRTSLHYSDRAVDISRARPSSDQGELGNAEKLIFNQGRAGLIQAAMWNELNTEVQESFGPHAAWSSGGLDEAQARRLMGRHDNHVHMGVKKRDFD